MPDSKYLPKITFKQIFLWMIKGLAVQCLLAYFFYKSWIAVGCLLPVGIIVFFQQWKEWSNKNLLDIESGFKDWLYYVKEGIGAGKSFEQSMLQCKISVANTLGEEHSFYKILQYIYRALELHIPIENNIQQIGEETGIMSIKNFAIVFQIARRQGGQMTSTLEKTIKQIHTQIDLRQEISAMLQAKKTEHLIMSIMPFGIICFVGKVSGGYFEPLYHNVRGIVTMTLCMIVYLFSVLWGRKLTEVTI